MKNLFPYGSWIWCVISGDSESQIEQNEGFFVAGGEVEAIKMLEKSLKEEYTIPFEFDGYQFIATDENGTKLWMYVEPLNCLNPEVCGN